ncbi:MAG: hypothetical protein QNJ46_35510 [Leptolyngbyaceae cyanobacterium MO_188.B28]|nr:hypothetical protein [Leptolyngbyaceae cyanobacterium MO_188.B28]
MATLSMFELSELFTCQVNLARLELDIRTAFADYTASASEQRPMLIVLKGQGRIAREFVDFLVQGIVQTETPAIGLVRNDLLIQFLVSSINLRCPKTVVKAFKTEADAKVWLMSCSCSF